MTLTAMRLLWWLMVSRLKRPELEAGHRSILILLALLCLQCRFVAGGRRQRRASEGIAVMYAFCSGLFSQTKFVLRFPVRWIVQTVENPVNDECFWYKISRDCVDGGLQKERLQQYELNSELSIYPLRPQPPSHQPPLAFCVRALFEKA